MSNRKNQWDDDRRSGDYPPDSRGDWEEYDDYPLESEPYEPDYYDEDDGGYDDETALSSSRRFNIFKREPGEREDIEPRETDFLVYDEELDELTAQDEDTEMRDYYPVRFRRDGKTGIFGGLMYAVFIISVSIVLACVLWMAASDVLALNKPEITDIVVIPKGFDIDDVADRLKEAGLIEYKFLFKFYSSFSNAEEKIEPGQYQLSTNLDYRALVKKMQVGSSSQLTTKVVIPEGFTMKQIFERLEENGICDVESLMECAANNEFVGLSFLDDIPYGSAERLEGYLFPDTYDFYEGEQASNVISKMLLNFHNRLTADMYAQAEGLGISLREAIIIASMIEAEAANDEERPKIAAVIYNRIRADMFLGIDATIQYILPERKAILTTEGENADTKIDNPYNTYLYKGIPPGPVSNPGIASINAALNPDSESSNLYYYALNATTKTHQFFTNHTDFDNFVASQEYSG